MSSHSDPSQKPASTPSKPAAARYISSSGHILETPPLSARLSRFSTDVYNFLGLYIVSLFSLDPYTAAQTSSFNTSGPGRGSGVQSRARWGSAGPATRNGNTGGRPGAGSGGGGGTGRRLGQVNDIREPECGSCG
ncbi:hypothetical protein, variant [Exophiala mesophila]|uniref:Uncharacterized protein n=1 Tax=Exophiala mesophila TaxID=212818 RepID=A0A0D1XIY6_EXOME|nr:uncharacterized protein PV10_09065 [Exophiala mesophila]XP_016219716.1 hypothetical protein, variant [Exophiala mesophila]KIV88141.1 hypothetical protein PV10_09065 [Exophiala mesophila]KIV88142.1 hypothetical protein, variant [Exophiala mesophila]